MFKDVQLNLKRADVLWLLNILKAVKRQAQERIVKANNFEDRWLSEQASNCARGEANRIEEVITTITEQFDYHEG